MTVQKETPRVVYVAVFVLGTTLGIFTGWSQSPVVGSLITGILGLLGGGALSFFVSRKDSEKGDKPQFNLSGAHSVAVSWCIMLLCGTTVLGTFLGITIRVNNFPFALVEDDVQLTDIPTSFPDLSPIHSAYLAALQCSLDRCEYPKAQNNQLIFNFTNETRSTIITGRDAIRQARTVIEFAKTVQDSLNTQAAPNPDANSSDSAIPDAILKAEAKLRKQYFSIKDVQGGLDSLESSLTEEVSPELKNLLANTILRPSGGKEVKFRRSIDGVPAPAYE